MGFLDWFKKKPELDYETLLQTLSQSIQDKQQHLSEIKLRERRSTLLVTLYLIAFWIIYAILWWVDYLPLGLIGFKSRSDDWEADEELGLIELYGGVVLLALPAMVGPVAIIFIRRTVKAWYNRQETSEEKQLRDLRAKQRSTIEEIKKKTNYYSTRNLLERYDEAPSPAASKILQHQGSLRKRGAFQPPVDPRLQPATPGSPSPTPSKLNTPAPETPITKNIPSTPVLSRPDLINYGRSPSFISPAVQPISPPVPAQKQWYDRLADAVLGDDAGGSKGDMGKFALVCEKCFAWNGLVEEARWGEMQYVCPKCGHFNPSPNSQNKKEASSLSSSLSAPPITRTRSRSPSPLAEGPKSGASTPVKSGGGKKKKGKGKGGETSEAGDL